MKFQAITYPLMLLICCIMFVGMLEWQNQAVYEFEQRQMDLQVNYAVDAAVQEMVVNSTHLGTDYADWGAMTVEPEVALDTYLAVLLRSLGWADSEENKAALIESSIPFFCVAGYDGYYMYMRQQDLTVDANGIKVTHYPHIWTPKLPYAYTDPSTQNVYFYNLGESHFGMYTYADNKIKEDYPYATSGSGYNTVSTAHMVINDTLTEAMNSALFFGLEGDVQSEFYLPASFNQWSDNNPIDNVSVLTYMSRSDQTTQYDTVTFGIGGAKIDEANFCICYTLPNGEKLYTWADKREIVYSTYPTIHNKIDRVVVSPAEAAKAGYYFDVRLGG